MMLLVNVNPGYYATRVQIAHTETATREEIIARARMEYSGDVTGIWVLRADDMSGPEVFEVATVTFWRD
jgi:hypothetical protein